MKKIVVLTGAGVSAESGLKTFRDHDGLWHDYRVEEVATPEAWLRNMDLVLEFYNQRRKNLSEASPNPAHIALARLEDKYDVEIITQNVDDLHERGGSSKVLHLHGELKRGDLCEKGSQLRPHIVWFGEPVPLIEDAAELCAQADIMIIIGTSLQVYPAAGLIHYAFAGAPKYYIDPKAAAVPFIPNIEIIRKNAGDGVPELVDRLLQEF